MKNSCLVIFTLFLIGCSNKTELLVGDNYILQSLEGNKDFIFNQMTSKELYYLLDKDAINLQSNKPISKYVKKTNGLILSLGVYDICSSFTFDGKKVSFNEEQLDRQIELFDYYIEQAFSLIENSNVYVLEQFNPFIDNEYIVFDSYINKINDILSSKADNYSFYYVELPEIRKYLVDDFVLLSESASYINSRIHD